MSRSVTSEDITNYLQTTNDTFKNMHDESRIKMSSFISEALKNTGEIISNSVAPLEAYEKQTDSLLNKFTRDISQIAAQIKAKIVGTNDLHISSQVPLTSSPSPAENVLNPDSLKTAENSLSSARRTLGFSPIKLKQGTQPPRSNIELIESLHSFLKNNLKVPDNALSLLEVKNIWVENSMIFSEFASYKMILTIFNHIKSLEEAIESRSSFH